VPVCGIHGTQEFERPDPGAGRTFPSGADDNWLDLFLAVWLNSNVAIDEAAAVFRALADPTRRQILQDLRDGDRSAGEIASRFPITGPSVSRHLSVLKGAGLIKERREANRIIYSLVQDHLALCVGGFLSVVCPDQVILRRRRNRPDEEA
jgi:DNA-binding transcriptional ArsR family regulator